MNQHFRYILGLQLSIVRSITQQQQHPQVLNEIWKVEWIVNRVDFADGVCELPNGQMANVMRDFQGCLR